MTTVMPGQPSVQLNSVFDIVSALVYSQQVRNTTENNLQHALTNLQESHQVFVQRIIGMRHVCEGPFVCAVKRSAISFGHEHS